MKTVLCYGDSITWGFNPADQTRFAFDVRWPGVVQTKLGADYRVVEEGLSGRTLFARARPTACTSTPTDTASSAQRSRKSSRRRIAPDSDAGSPAGSKHEFPIGPPVLFLLVDDLRHAHGHCAKRTECEATCLR